jgi:hypothetical protein
MLSSNDLLNGSAQTSGHASFSPLDWINFENVFRAWGKYVAATPIFSAALGGNCAVAGNCQVYDWRLKATDTVSLNHFGAFPVSGSACPASLNASVSTKVIASITGQTYLRSAVEILDPYYNPNGDYDGVCESNEACLYTPNFGAYQGSGDFSTQTCTFTGGNGVTGVTIYAYPNNGI